jgi:hypothetical protein
MSTVRLTNFWVCRGVNGLLHVAKIERVFNTQGVLVHMQGCTACLPRLQSCRVPRGDWGGKNLPQLTLDAGDGYSWILLIEYWVRETPTCLNCVVMARSP